MDLAERFVAAVTQLYAMVGDGAELLPTVLARACVKVLPIAGASLSLTDELRIPLGASDDVAARAEQLQATLGEGPCLTATATGHHRCMTLPRWPAPGPCFTTSSRHRPPTGPSPPFP